jgi:hypothetical protein
MSRRPLLTATLLVAALIPAAAAHAAYAPTLKVTITPTTQSASPAVTSEIFQASGESANKTVVVGFPVGFGSPFGYAVPSCSAEQEAARACPSESQIGTAEAKISDLIPVNGTVNFGGTINGKVKMIVFLGEGLTAQPPIEGFVTLRKDGGFDVVFDGVPNTPTTYFALKLDGKPKSLVVNPVTCGKRIFVGRFTSHNGETATSEAPVEITGCVNKPPQVTNLVFTPERIRQGRQLLAEYVLSEKATVAARVHRKTKSGAVVKTLMLQGARSDNSFKLGKGLKPGTYVLELVATDPEGLVSKPERETFKVLKKKRKKR